MTKVKVSPVARAIPFDGTGTTFTSTDTQSAIVEAKNIAVGLPRYTLLGVFNGIVSDGNWLSYSNLVPGDTVPILIPVKCSLKEVTFYNINSASGRLDFYRNGTLAENIFDSLSITNSTSGTKANFTQIFNLGDTLRARWVDLGTNPNDAVIVYFFQVEE